MSILIKFACILFLSFCISFSNGYYVALVPKVIRERSSSLMVIANIGLDHAEQFKIVQNGKVESVTVPINVTMDGNEQTLQVKGMTTPISQNLTLPSNVRRVKVTTKGTGTGVFQIAYRYNQIATDDEPRFEVIKTIRRSSSDSVLDLTICARFKPKIRYEATNMVLMEVLFPSGYVVADKTISSLKGNKKVMKIEKEQEDTRLVLYFDSLSKVNSTCVEVFGLKKATVLGQITGLIKVYDYYDPDRQAFEYFSAKAETS